MTQYINDAKMFGSPEGLPDSLALEKDGQAGLPAKNYLKVDGQAGTVARKSNLTNPSVEIAFIIRSRP